MKKILASISILSAFLIISTACIPAMQVQATDASVRQSMGALAAAFNSDENVQTLLNDPDFIELLNKEETGEIDFETLQNEIQELDLFDEILSEYEEDLLSLYNNILTLPGSKEKSSSLADNEYLRIYVDSNNVLRVKKQTNNDVTNGILLNKDGDITVPTESGTSVLEGQDWVDLVTQIVVYLTLLFAGAEVLGALLTLIGKAIIWVGTNIQNVGGLIVIVGLVAIAGAAILGYVLALYLGLVEPDSNGGKSKKYGSLVYKLKLTFQRMLAKALTLFQNVRLQQCVA